MRDSFEKITLNSKRKPNLIETDRGKEFYNSTLQKLLKKITAQIFPEIHTSELILLEGLIVLSEIYLKSRFVKRLKAFGLIYYLG